VCGLFAVVKRKRASDRVDRKGATNMDSSNGGSGVEYPKTLAKAAAGIKGVESVIPGHSPLMTWNDFKEYGDFMRELVSAAEQAKKDGKDVDKAAADLKLPEKYKDYTMDRLKADVTVIYSELK